MKLESYVVKDHKRMRRGYTTGSCAAGAAKGAAILALSGQAPSAVELDTPGGIPLVLEILSPRLEEGEACCAVQKDSGDDPDVTRGVLVWARVKPRPEPGIVIDGGEGVGRVTRPGLDQPVGAAAINRVPRRMIAQAVEEVCRRFGYQGGMEVTISIPAGVELAARTFNPRLGIVGGISVLGTTGIVEPMSDQALVDTIQVEMNQLAATGNRKLILTPGNYGEEYLRQFLPRRQTPVVKCSNFLGEALDQAARLGMTHLLFVAHIGKLVKVAAGVMNTHSRYGDGRMEILTAHAALAGAPRPLLEEIFHGVTTDQVLDLLDEAGLTQAVMASVLERVEFHLKARLGPSVKTAAVTFRGEGRFLGQSAGAAQLLMEMEEEENGR